MDAASALPLKPSLPSRAWPWLAARFLVDREEIHGLLCPEVGNLTDFEWVWRKTAYWEGVTSLMGKFDAYSKGKKRRRWTGNEEIAALAA